MPKKFIDDKIAIQLYQSGKNLKEIAAYFGSKWGISISRVLRKHGIKPMSHWERFDASIDCNAVVSEYLAGESMVSIAKRYGTEHHAIRRILRKSGITEIRDNYSYWTLPLNHNAFSDITEESSYWTGFIMADGNIKYVKHYSPQIRLELSSKDAAHIAKFKIFVGAKAHTTRTRTVTRESGNTYSYKSLTIVSNQIASDLASYGVTTNKTKRTCVSILSECLHFWRGVTDGDGCLFPSSDRVKFELVGTCKLMNQFADFVNNKLEFRPGVKRYSNRNVWTVSMSGPKALKIIGLLYSDCHIYLDRKKQRADYLMQHSAHLGTEALD